MRTFLVKRNLSFIRCNNELTLQTKWVCTEWPLGPCLFFAQEISNHKSQVNFRRFFPKQRVTLSQTPFDADNNAKTDIWNQGELLSVNFFSGMIRVNLQFIGRAGSSFNNWRIFFGLNMFSLDSWWLKWPWLSVAWAASGDWDLRWVEAPGRVHLSRAFHLALGHVTARRDPH